MNTRSVFSFMFISLVIGLFATSVRGDELESAKKFYADKEYVKAAESFKVFAQSGNADAQRALGILYEFGRGVPQDDQQAVFWYQKAADQGSDIAQDRLGAMYENGRGVSQDYLQAIFWYRKAAEKGLHDAEFHLGWLYDIGKGVEQSYQQAAIWYRKAAGETSGSAAAKYNLAVLYDFGRGVKQDYDQAIMWYAGASENLASAQFQSGWMHELGITGVAQDYITAISWYQQAADQAYPLAWIELNALKSNARTEPCDMQSIDTWETHASEGLPLKPGLWKIQTSLISRQVTVSKAEKQTCFAEKALCINEKRALPAGQFWPGLSIADGLGRYVNRESDSEAFSYLDWEGNSPIESHRIARNRFSNDKYKYTEILRTVVPWMPIASPSQIDRKIDMVANFAGACSKN